MDYWESALWVCPALRLKTIEQDSTFLSEMRYLRVFKAISSIYFSSRQAGTEIPLVAGIFQSQGQKASPAPDRKSD